MRQEINEAYPGLPKELVTAAVNDPVSQSLYLEGSWYLLRQRLSYLSNLIAERLDLPILIF
jgi:hypothetical protein